MNMGDGCTLAFTTDVLVDQGDAFGKKEQLQSGHGGSPFEEGDFAFSAIFAKSTVIAQYLCRRQGSCGFYALISGWQGKSDYDHCIGRVQEFCSLSLAFRT
ncbi:hypothetical protein [Desulfobulbus alkaliphilus]|uniref:hypothetical protein n=1 Tax=Desulfobulbus alkaliphilus TaxID=869814 RepID=UPI001962883B|nr:hypothetical protein [Desulfobulbus alkaliphilus]MBM9537678.1 hypothetical protein [Desulfobulbus alkaliphilus]